jgi:hypothetical protein
MTIIDEMTIMIVQQFKTGPNGSTYFITKFKSLIYTFKWTD